MRRFRFLLKLENPITLWKTGHDDADDGSCSPRSGRAACDKVLIANKELQVIIQHNLPRSTVASATATATARGCGQLPAALENCVVEFIYPFYYSYFYFIWKCCKCTESSCQAKNVHVFLYRSFG